MGSPDPRPAARAAGDVLDGRYRLAVRLGHGGFGDVWRAEELLPDGAPFRDVALKLLLAGAADAGDWAEEAKLLASFRHPSLVTIYAAGILATSPPQRFVAMELLLGTNLADLLRARGAIPWRRVLGWAVSTAAALDLIHAAGVVHLDLKPANLFLSNDGALKVLDFGIARRAGVASVTSRGRRGERLDPEISARDAELATGLFIAHRAAASHDEEAFAPTRRQEDEGDSGDRRVVIGTPGFMAPEVLELAEPTAAADAYALAVCVVQLSTGHLPLAAPDEPASWDDPTAVSLWLDAIRTATLRGALRPILEGPAGLPRGLGALLLRLLSVDPGRRGVVPGELGALFGEAWERPYGVPDPPYFGLAPFPPDGEGLLFGRDDDLARLGRELSFEPALVLQGPAEAGKSSLAVAGLVPYLARRGADGKDDWIAVPVAPTARADSDAALDAALARAEPTLAGAGIDELTAHCDASPIGLVLLVDPLVAAGAGPPTRLDALCEAIATGPVRAGLRLVATVGEEGAAALLATPLGASLRAALRFVGPPGAAAVNDIVAAPAALAGVRLSGVERVTADVQRELRGGGVRLPYVALALAEWWASSVRGGTADDAPIGGVKSGAPSSAGSLHGDRWRASGGVRGAVVRHADRVFAALGAAERRIAEDLLLRLSTTDGRSLAWDVDELVGAAGGDEPSSGEPAARQVLERLERERVVRVERVERGTVEIGHEALLLAWPTLASARLAHMDRLSLLERLRDARLAWERADEHADFLLHGALLDEVRAKAAWAARGLTPADRAFLGKSRRRARARRAARWAAGVIGILVLAGGAWIEHLLGEAREAEARAKAAAIELEQLAELAARARSTDDAYHRVAFTAAAMERGSPDARLPLELAATASNLARAQFLSLAPIHGPTFPWDDRFLLGGASASSLAIVDFRPPEPDVIDDVALDFDPDAEPAAHFKRPAIRRLRPHETAVVQRVPFGFDTSFVTRASDGEVKVFRLRDDGVPALAAIAPFRCAGAALVASAAPVIACATDRGLARWDLRRSRAARGDAVTTHAFSGNVADLSADGAHVAAVAGKRVLLWSPVEGREALYVAPRPVTLARFGPREPVVALLEGADVEIVDARGAPLLSFSASASASMREKGVESLRWDDGGLDVALCGPRGGAFRYLRSGGRAAGDPRPEGDPCAPPRPKGQPEPLRTPDDYADIGDRDLGPHTLLGGWKLRRHRYLSRDLVLFDAGVAPPGATGARGAPSAAARLLRFEGRDELGGDEAPGDDDSVVAVERDESTVMFQVKDELRFYALMDSSRLFTRRGNFLRRCADGRYLAWIDEGKSYRAFDAWTGNTAGVVPRAPGLVVGADAACATLYTQRLDGVLVAHPLGGGAARELAAADGYVFDARPSAARGGHGGGLLLALGSGAIVRLDDAGAAVHVLGYATPEATAIADGPRPGEVLFADATGVGLLRSDAGTTWLKTGAGAGDWEDLSVAPDGESLLLASDGRIAVLDLQRRELLGSIVVEGRGRLSRWDDDGSVLAWSFGRRGGAEGVVIPRGVALARAVATAVSNLTVEKGRLALRR